jgi:hypothetical protein
LQFLIEDSWSCIVSGRLNRVAVDSVSFFIDLPAHEIGESHAGLKVGALFETEIVAFEDWPIDVQ